MIIEKYKKNLKNISLPSDFNHQDIGNYTSDFEYCKQFTTYHFDTDVKEKEGDYYDVVGTFVGDWSAELNQAIKDSFPARCRDRNWPVLGGPVPTLQLEINDEEGWGYRPEHAQSNAVKNRYLRENCPNIIKMVEYFQLEDVTYKFMCQMPGQSFRWHIDKMQHRCPEDPWRIIRLQIALADWMPGQFWQYGNCFYKQWKQGEVTIFDWVNVPHATGNAGRWARPFIQMTGLRTKETDRILEQSSRNTKFYL